MATFGNTAPASHTTNYDSVLSTTLKAYKPVMFDNIFKSSAFLAALRSNDGVTFQDGGERIQQLLMYETNSTAKSYSGYGLIDTTPQDGMTSAFESWREIAATISISRLEERQNSGEARIVSLLEQKVKQAEMSLKEAVNRQLVEGGVAVEGTSTSNQIQIGNSGKDLNPLGWMIRKFIASEPVDGISVGGISAATYSWWRTRAIVGDSATKDTGGDAAVSISNFATLLIALRKLYNYCSRGADGSGPNICLMNQGTYEVYEAGLDAKMRYSDTKMAEMGFDTVKLKGATCVWDELVPNMDEHYKSSNSAYSTNNKEGTVFMLNTKFLKLVIDKQTDFATTDFVTPENQTARTAKVLFMGNLCSSNQRKQGLLYAISNTLTA